MDKDFVAHRSNLILLFICALLPGSLTYLYVSTESSIVYALSKFLPLILLIWLSRKALSIEFSVKGLLPALTFALAVGLGVYGLSQSQAFLDLLGPSTGNNIAEKLTAFGITSKSGFIFLAGFTCLFNSFFEEIFWRWGIFRLANGKCGFHKAALLSSLCFSLHHLVVLLKYFPKENVVALAILFSLFTSIGGYFWCWHYKKWKSLSSLWLSHLLIDVWIMIFAYSLIFPN
jgi:membrane protease YdiL (CAAX protease family)